MIRPPPSPTLFPYTTLFRSAARSSTSSRTSPGRPRSCAPSCIVCCGCRSRRTRRSRSPFGGRSEEHTSELRHLVISYAVFCLKKKKDELTEAADDCEGMQYV